MKISKSELKRLIKEELNQVNEGPRAPGPPGPSPPTRPGSSLPPGTPLPPPAGQTKAPAGEERMLKVLEEILATLKRMETK